MGERNKERETRRREGCREKSGGEGEKERKSVCVREEDRQTNEKRMRELIV